MKIEDRSASSRQTLWLLAGMCALVPLESARANPDACIVKIDLDGGVPEAGLCDKVLFCTFLGELKQKEAVLKLYQENARPEDRLYKEAKAEAKANPGKDEGTIFDSKVRKELQAVVNADPGCGVFDVPDDAGAHMLPNWQGMQTSAEDCNYYVQTDAGDLLPRDAKERSTSCLEFWQRDEGHENLHITRCNARKASERAKRALQQHISEEIDAYGYSVDRAANDLLRLALRCSADDTLKKRIDRATLLKGYIDKYAAKGK